MTHNIGIGSFLAPNAALDPTVSVPDSCYIGFDAQVGAQVSLKTGCTVGNRARLIGPIALGRNVQIGADTVLAGPLEIGENARIGRGCVIGMGRGLGIPRGTQTSIAKGAHIGRGARVLAGLAIGENACLLPESVLEGDLPANAQAGGNPARLLGVVCVCGRPINPDPQGDGFTFHCPKHTTRRVQVGKDFRDHIGCMLKPCEAYGDYFPLENHLRQSQFDFEL